MQAANNHAFKSTSVIKHTNYQFLRSLKVNCGGVLLDVAAQPWRVTSCHFVYLRYEEAKDTNAVDKEEVTVHATGGHACRYGQISSRKSQHGWYSLASQKSSQTS